MQGAHEHEAKRMGSWNMETRNWCKRYPNLYGTGNQAFFHHAVYCRQLKFAQIRGHFQAWCRCCTYARRSWTCSKEDGELKYENPQSMQTVNKSVRVSKPSLLAPRRTLMSTQFCANSGYFPAWCRCCTNARCTWTRSKEDGELKYGNPQSVQTVPKPVWDFEPSLFAPRRIVQLMKLCTISGVFSGMETMLHLCKVQ